MLVLHGSTLLFLWFGAGRWYLSNILLCIYCLFFYISYVGLGLADGICPIYFCAYIVFFLHIFYSGLGLADGICPCKKALAAVPSQLTLMPRSCAPTVSNEGECLNCGDFCFFAETYNFSFWKMSIIMR